MSMRIAVVGSINLDLVAGVERLPLPGETITGARLARHPGGKGANQALAAQRLGAQVALIGAVGDDAAADEALSLLRAEGVDLSGVARLRGQATGLALIAVDAHGENQIIVAAGANHAVAAPVLPDADAVILQLELPLAVVEATVATAPGFVCVNLAPAQPVSEALLRRADLLVVNEGEAAFYGAGLHAGDGLVAVTLGGRGAELWRGGARLAAATAPAVEVVDTVGAGDGFCAALTLALIEGRTPEAALRFACAAGALAVTRPGAQPSLPRRAEVESLLARA